MLASVLSGQTADGEYNCAYLTQTLFTWVLCGTLGFRRSTLHQATKHRLKWNYFFTPN
jgi:hypothetical protein